MVNGHFSVGNKTFYFTGLQVIQTFTFNFCHDFI